MGWILLGIGFIWMLGGRAEDVTFGMILMAVGLTYVALENLGRNDRRK